MEGKLTIGLDGESVIKKLEHRQLPKVTDKHYDMLTDCKTRIKQLPIKIQFKYIEGHQDNKKKKKKDLDWWATTNIRMDKLAK